MYMAKFYVYVVDGQARGIFRSLDRMTGASILNAENYRHYEVSEGLSIIFLNAFLSMLLVLLLKSMILPNEEGCQQGLLCAYDRATMSN